MRTCWRGHHDGEHLAKFEELLEAAVDLDRIPDEYLICASYDADLQARAPPDCSQLLLSSGHLALLPHPPLAVRMLKALVDH